jgi:2-polyprenyl-3-methyl-5-hydroxy-6-metoxy-1,4-benzoquinol methylase
MFTQPNPKNIMETGLGFWRSRALLVAVQHGVFTHLAAGPMTGEQLRAATGWHPRGVYDLLDGLVAMGFLERDGDGPAARYRNTKETATFLDRGKPAYLGGILEMAGARLYRFWADLDEAMLTGQPQNEIKHSGKPVFAELYADPARLEQFMSAMEGLSRPNFETLARKFDFSRFATLLDVGGATALLSRCVAKQHPRMRCLSFDLPEVEPIARRHIAADGLSDRVTTASGDFFRDPFPKADVVTMGMILHDWNLEKKMQLIRAARAAVRDGGAFIAVEMIIDDKRRENVPGLMMSLNMLVEFGDAFDFTGADFSRWCLEAGFKRTEVMPLVGPTSAAIAWA